MNDFSLHAIFEGTSVPVYVYKLFPEGPITMTLIREMRQMWQEMMTILDKLSAVSQSFEIYGEGKLSSTSGNND